MPDLPAAPPPAPSPAGSRARAWCAVVLLTLLALAGAWALAGPPRGQRVAPGRPGRAAVAYRDDVHPVEKLLTWAYVAPRLEGAYDVVRTVTRGGIDASDEVLEALKAATARSAEVDLFLLAHGNRVIDAVETLPRAVTSRIRLVYDSGCTDGEHAPRWSALGVRAFVGHPESASHAPFFYEFLRRWVEGRPLGDAVEEGNRFTTDLYGRLAPVGFAEEAALWSRSHAVVTGSGDVRIGGGP